MFSEEMRLKLMALGKMGRWIDEQSQDGGERL
jgi:hypothetical protein